MPKPDQNSDLRSVAAATDAVAASAGPTRASGGSDPLLGDLRRGGVLQLLTLHLLREGRSYGNQLIERIADLTNGWLTVNPNTIYPLLRKLEADGLIVGEWEHPERRSRRYYLITDSGRQSYELLRESVLPLLVTVASGVESIRVALLDQ